MSAREYIRQMRKHRKRMRQMGEAFGGPVAAVTRIHDVEKWLFLPLLLCFREGRGNRQAARVVYNAMNAVGRVITFGYMARFSRAQRAHAAKWERVLDCVDRNSDPAARIEFGDAAPPLSAFLSGEMLQLGESSDVQRLWRKTYLDVERATHG